MGEADSVPQDPCEPSWTQVRDGAE
jgi:hypothetical protein